MAELTSLAGRLACQARTEAHADRPLYVAGSLPPLEENFRAGIAASDATKAREAAAAYKVIVGALAEHVDFFIVETQSTIEEALIPGRVVHSHSGGNTPVVLSWTVGEDGRLRGGETVAEAVMRAEQDPQANAFGYAVNCAQPPECLMALREMQAALDERSLGGERILCVAPNNLVIKAGYRTVREENAMPEKGDVTLSSFQDYVREFQKLPSCRVIGGCCGIFSEHTHATLGTITGSHSALAS